MSIVEDLDSGFYRMAETLGAIHEVDFSTTDFTRYVGIAVSFPQ